MITVVPEMKTEARTAEHDYLFLACDGIWDCMTS
jgi:serine/threonine protein phosphatase PrpC